jgi:fatty acid desaturase
MSTLHPPPAARAQRLQRKQDAFALFSAACYLGAWWLWGWRAALYALWSLSVKASRFDVVGWGQDMAEHNSDDEHKPTNSTYTWWNVLFCNTGYHAEHHTFPLRPFAQPPAARAVTWTRACSHVDSSVQSRGLERAARACAPSTLREASTVARPHSLRRRRRSPAATCRA